MSGIYIKGMEMPVSCTRCPLSDDDVVFCHAAKKYIPMLGHPTFCPLIEVPDHGRLIDETWLKAAMIETLESLKRNPKMDRQEAHLIAAFDTLRVMLEDAPTIIPADKEADDGET